MRCTLAWDNLVPNILINLIVALYFLGYFYFIRAVNSEVQVYVVVDPWVWCGWFFRKESILGAETLMGFASGSSSFSHRGDY